MSSHAQRNNKPSQKQQQQQAKSGGKKPEVKVQKDEKPKPLPLPVAESASTSGEDDENLKVRSYRKRELVSNWSRYEVPIGGSDDEAEGADFNRLLELSGI